jgi:site-specific recombinase XerD
MTDNVILEEARHALRQDGKSSGTSASYLSHIRRLVDRFGPSAKDLDAVEIRAYVSDLSSRGRSQSYSAQARSALRFFYTRLAGRPDPLSDPGLAPGQEVVDRIFTREEIADILEHTDNPSYRLAFMLMYASGLRTGEVCSLRRRNIDTERMQIRVTDRAGRFMRETILPGASLALLYQCLAGRSEDQPYLFPGRGRTVCITPRTLQRVFDQSLALAGVERDTRTSLGWLRHSFAVHLLEDGVDRRLVQELMGIGTSAMMAPYLKLAGNRSRLRVLSPIDRFCPEMRFPG